jgi:hypothetical protein
MHNPDLALPVPRFILYSIITLGIYPFYWGWRAWSVVGQAEDRRYAAILRGFFLTFTCFSLFVKLSTLAKAYNRPARKSERPLVLALIFALTQLLSGTYLNTTDQLGPLVATSAFSLLITIMATIPAVQDYTYFVSRTTVPLHRPSKFWEQFFLALMVTVACTSTWYTYIR